ncbi:hypothetical protein [Ruegeria arenilitoris]|uniref:hypothetical protein n=1 Tax=Ruegeria arenilitoris TaxID=1173585 RepID=UPI00147D0F64|nr:hypothetical protein [Ruegeria arenilitoris]
MTAEAEHMRDRAVSQAGSGRRRAALWLLFGGLLAVMLAALFGRIMSFGLRRDELMFVAPAELLGQWRLYQDFFYNHVPDSAWYFRGLYLITGQEGLLGSARLGVFLGWIALIGGTGWVTWRLSGSALLAAFFIMVLMVDGTLLAQAGMAASNNLLPLPFVVWGVGGFLLETQRDHPRPVVFVLIGVCLSIAAGMKVSAVVFIPPVAIATFLMPGHMAFAERVRRVTLPMLAGGLLGALPLFWYMAVDPAVFIAHVLKFHTGPHVAYWQANAASEPDLALGLGGKVQLAYSVWLGGAALVCLFVVAYLTVLVRSGGMLLSELGAVLLVLVLIAVTAAFSFVPSPGFPQYYIQPLVMIPLLGALVFRKVGPEQRSQVAPVLAAGFALLAVLGAPRLVPGLAALSDPSGFTTTRVAQGAEALKAALAESAHPDGPVATIMPIYPLEAQLPVYLELSTGPFAYRIAPYTEPDLAAKYVMADAAGLQAVFDSNPPSAFLLGYDPALEQPLLRYAETNGYQPVEISGLGNRYGQGVVYLKPSGATE